MLQGGSKPQTSQEQSIIFSMICRQCSTLQVTLPQRVTGGISIRLPGRLRVPEPGTDPEHAVRWPSPEGTSRGTVEPKQLKQSGTAAPSSALSPHAAEWRVGGFSLHCKSLLIRVLQCCLEGKQPLWRESKGVQNSTCSFSCPRQVLELAPGEPGSVDKAKASQADSLAGSRNHPFLFSCACLWHR